MAAVDSKSPRSLSCKHNHYKSVALGQCDRKVTPFYKLSASDTSWQSYNNELFMHPFFLWCILSNHITILTPYSSFETPTFIAAFLSASPSVHSVSPYVPPKWANQPSLPCSRIFSMTKADLCEHLRWFWSMRTVRLLLREAAGSWNYLCNYIHQDQMKRSVLSWGSLISKAI